MTSTTPDDVFIAHLTLEPAEAAALGFQAPPGMPVVLLTVAIDLSLEGPLRELYQGALVNNGGAATRLNSAISVRRGKHGTATGGVA